MKQVRFFIIAVIKGSLFFFLPLVFKWASLSILIGLAILLVCFAAWLLMRSRLMKSFGEGPKEIPLRFCPHYKKIKQRESTLNRTMKADEWLL